MNSFLYLLFHVHNNEFILSLDTFKAVQFYPHDSIAYSFIISLFWYKIFITKHGYSCKSKQESKWIAQPCPTLCNLMDCSLPGSSIHGIFLGKNIGVGCHSLLQGLFLTQGSNLCLPHCLQTLYHLSHQGSPQTLGSSGIWTQRQHKFRICSSWALATTTDTLCLLPGLLSLGPSLFCVLNSLLSEMIIISVAQLCPTLCDPMNLSTPGLPVHHQLPGFTQTHTHRVSDAIQPSHPLLSPSPPAPNPSQHQSLFQWANSSHEVAKVLEFQL